MSFSIAYRLKYFKAKSYAYPIDDDGQEFMVAYSS
jgi:hypothetical protein